MGVHNCPLSLCSSWFARQQEWSPVNFLCPIVCFAFKLVMIPFTPALPTPSSSSWFCDVRCFIWYLAPWFWLFSFSCPVVCLSPLFLWIFSRSPLTFPSSQTYPNPCWFVHFLALHGILIISVALRCPLRFSYFIWHLVFLSLFVSRCCISLRGSYARHSLPHAQLQLRRR